MLRAPFGDGGENVLFKRILYGGIGIAIVWLVFLAVPLMWLRDVDHPLMAQAAVDVCSYMSDPVLAKLPKLPDAVKRGVPGEKDTGKPACSLEWPEPKDGTGTPSLWAMVTTERMLNAGGGGRPARTDKFTDTWLRESAASGYEVTEIKGPWRRAALMRMKLKPEEVSLLADDAGLVVWINGRGIDDAPFVAFSEAFTKGLRDKPGNAPKR
jgi:hypothetical protein